MTFMLETLRGDETLDAGGFGVRFLAFALGLHLAANDKFADLEGTEHQKKPPVALQVSLGNTHIIVLTQPEELPDLRRPLRPQPLGMHRIR